MAEAIANDQVHLFTNLETGKGYQGVKKAFSNALKDAGIGGFRFPDLRHTFASLVGDELNVMVNALAETLGHKNWKTTKHYTHAAKEAKVRVIQVVEIRP